LRIASPRQTIGTRRWSGMRRAKVFPRMEADPTGFADSSGQGPFGPSDENARRLLLGEW